ncbi:MAG: CHAD domain-containing protein [Thermodesulfobacteriota bacterium]
MVALLEKSDYYRLPDGLERLELLRRFTTDHSFILDPSHKKKEEFLDTFDRRLHSANLVLIREARSYYLRDLTQGHTVASLEGDKSIDPKFWWDFPKCSLRLRIKPLCDIRALLSLAKIERSIATLRLLNEDKKTVLLAYVKELKILNRGERKPAVVVQIKPIRGYEEEAGKFKKYLETLGLEAIDGDLISAAGSFDGKYPLHYSSKINVHLKPEMKSLDAAKMIFRNLLETMKVNEFGIIEDIDTEFLHDFRVAVRRTRSALSQIKAVFSVEDTIKFKDEFSVIGKATNELRDLDVYLLTEDSYKKMLPEDLRPGLDPLFDSLSEQREKAKKECADYLRSDSYKKSIRTWEEFLDNSKSDPELAPNSERSVINLAKENIWKKYSRVIKLGKRIHANTPDPEVHSLRIEGKKLRYLLEFFASLFPEDEMKVVIKHLKKLQDNLGDFNDLYVQQQSLKKFLSQTDIGYDHSKQKTLAAAGGLVSVLYQRQNDVRKKFKENFDGFSDKETTSLFNSLFSKG